MSGSFFYYANRETVRWELLDGDRFAVLRSHASLPWYAIALVPTLAMLTGLMIGIECIVHYTTNPTDDPNIKAFGLPFNAASPVTWGVALALVLIGFVIARRTWTWIAQAWDHATSAPPEQATLA